MKVRFDIPVAMSDCTLLLADVWLPDGDGPFPTLLQRVPYDRGAPTIRDGALDVVKAVRRGYAVVTQDCRGRFGSHGEFVPFLDEAADGADTIGWIRQQPWSDGKVGMFGRSYSAFVQWQAAARRPEGLLAIAPMFSGTDPARDWFGADGSLEWGFLGMWTLRHLAVDALRRTGRDDAVAAAGRIAVDVDAVLLETGAGGDVAIVLSALPWLQEWFDDDGRSAAFEAISKASADPADVSIPALVIGGWFDIFLAGTLRAADGLAGSRSLVIGPWPHGGNNPGVFPELSFGPAASGDAVGLTDRQLAWFDRWLRDDDVGPGETATWFHRGIGWQSGAQWPPADATSTVLQLGDSGLLSAGTTSSGVHRLTYDESDPAPTVGGATFLPGLEVAVNAGPRDQRTLLDRDDVVCWFTEPLATDLDVVGHVYLDLHADAAPGTRVVARLVEAGIDGRVMLVCDGAAVCTGAGPMYVELSPTAWTFPAESRVGVVLSNTSAPRYRRFAGDRPGAAPARGVIDIGPGSTLHLGGPRPKPATGATTMEGPSL